MEGKNKTARKLKSLRKVFEGKSSLLIVIQDNPDPDSIAAALALRKLSHSFGDISCSIAHSGSIGRAENRALVKYLPVNLRQMSEIDIARYDVVAMVDTQPDTGNNALAQGAVADIVIDHHPCRRSTRAVKFIDIRRKYGAAATIVLEYLRCAKIEIDTQLATAIVYAIRSDTQDLGREACKADIEAMQYLYPLANLKILSQIQRGRVERGYFALLAAAISNARSYGSCIITSLGDTDNPDMNAEIADLLLRDEKTQWTLCYCFSRGQMLLSLRNIETELKAGDVMRRIVSRKGTGGGHDSMAGGQIKLSQDTAVHRKKLEKIICARFLKQLGINPSAAQKLL